MSEPSRRKVALNDRRSGMTYSAIAKKLTVSVTRARQLVHDAEMDERLIKKGLHPDYEVQPGQCCGRCAFWMEPWPDRPEYQTPDKKTCAWAAPVWFRATNDGVASDGRAWTAKRPERAPEWLTDAHLQIKRSSADGRRCKAFRRST